ncbi:hypothetical protein EAG_02890 [Camponotus floridanus]|uniref:Uncharacterized protein n=1 Tax=Camponotus floridanus TaxID=104421 RepID=E2AGH0_CAMFO|nr:hypothetical protein EAG_02890 [Camponotus floridanus]
MPKIIAGRTTTFHSRITLNTCWLALVSFRSGPKIDIDQSTQLSTQHLANASAYSYVPTTVASAERIIRNVVAATAGGWDLSQIYHKKRPMQKDAKFLLLETLCVQKVMQLEFAQYPRQGAVKQATLQVGNLPMAPCEILESYCYTHEKSIDAIMHLFLVPPAPTKRKTHVVESRLRYKSDVVAEDSRCIDNARLLALSCGTAGSCSISWVNVRSDIM